ncbi:hypothetical protein TWF730_001354 [Orbilia blumenaviensis]|uniref:RRM domain-containing protein n=1 Tax=Orbilia blumenaviensis TaxID=1796055 RepID=A0AAV9UNN9_9PEZI
MADDDNFDIDIYGEDLDDPSAPYKKVAAEDELFHDDDGKADAGKSNGNNTAANGTTEDTNMEGANVNDNVKQEPTPQPPQHNSLKRKHPDNRHVDVNATTALYISELNWWTTDDDIRGWIRQADCEDELKDITFSEHKVNGKSKGVAFVEFTTTQASSATKAKIESFATKPGYQSKHHTVNFTQPHSNPFRTLPKDAPARNKDDNRSGPGNFKDNRPHGPMGNNFPSPANFAPQSNMMGNNMGGGSGYRGGRGGMMGGRGNMGGGGGGGYMNRNNTGSHMGGSGGGGGGGSGSPPQQFGMMNQPGGFGNMGGGGGGGMQFQGGGGGFQGNRGGMNMGMRGGGPPNRGRGGFNNNMGMPMGGMAPNMGMNPPMGGMNMGGPMGNMGGGDMSGGNSNFNPMMGSGFNPMMGGGAPQYPNFTPQFFGQPQQGEQQWNPHGNKRPRQDG